MQGQGPWEIAVINWDTTQPLRRETLIATFPTEELAYQAWEMINDAEELGRTA